MRYRYPALLLLSFMLAACVPPTEKEPALPVAIDVTDATYRKITDLQHQRAQSELLYYLRADSASHRYLAARAFGSFPTLEQETIDSLIIHLTDPVEEVKIQAAYALGQTGNSLITPFLTAAFDRSGTSREFDAMLLQSVGKTGDQQAADLLANISTYRSTDSLLIIGRAWGIYYAALRGYRSPTADSVMVDLATNGSMYAAARHPAAHYLHRVEFPISVSQVSSLEGALRSTNDVVIATGIISTLGRSGAPSARLALLSRSDKTEDWRERVEVIRALAGFEYAGVRESILDLLRDPHPLVRLTATDFLVEYGTAADAPLYVDLAKDPALTPNGSVGMYRAANRHLSPYLTDYRDRIVNSLRKTYSSSDDGYLRAQTIIALAEYPWTYRMLQTYYTEATLPVVRTAIVEGLRSISEREDFDAYFRGSSQRVRRELAAAFQDYILGAEEGPAYHAAAALSTSAEIYRDRYPETEWIDDALDKFRLPQQLETYTEVFRAANALVGSEKSLPEIADRKRRKIDWQLLAAAKDRSLTLQVPAGEIRLKLYPTVAPATVSSFLQLVEEDYYSGKVFHRIVPDFVAQGGGPRGDGFGSEDFTLATETPYLHYDRPGLIGMASAGKDTEGVQFFFTHRAVPHLEGKYTIFGEITAGQSIVDRMVPGTPIIRMSLD